MKPKGIRLLANLILWIGVIAGLLGCIFALLLAQGNPLKVPTEYVPNYVDFIIIGAEILLVLIIAIVLHAVAGRKEKRARIRAAWGNNDGAEEEIFFENNAEEPVVEVEEIIDAEEPIAEEPTPEEPVADEVAVEEAEAEAPKKQNKLLVARAKIAEKTPLSEKQVTVAVAAVLAAIPLALAGVAYGKKNAQLKAYKKKEKRRKEFFDWLG